MTQQKKVENHIKVLDDTTAGSTFQKVLGERIVSCEGTELAIGRFLSKKYYYISEAVVHSPFHQKTLSEDHKVSQAPQPSIFI
jgi:hypothetical protein